MMKVGAFQYFMILKIQHYISVLCIDNCFVKGFQVHDDFTGKKSDGIGINETI